MLLIDVKVRIEAILAELKSFNSMTLNGTCQWLRPPKYQELVDELNPLINEVNKQLKREYPLYDIQKSDYSKSGITINNGGINRFKLHLEKLLELLYNEEKQAEGNRFRCFMIGKKCSFDIQSEKYDFFIGMPFAAEKNDSYRYGIVPALDAYGLSKYRADEDYKGRQLMCKICKAIQESKNVLIDISENNPNVMFELGLACGRNKPYILIKDSSTGVPTDLQGLEYIKYEDAKDLQLKLREVMKRWGLRECI